MFLQQNAETTRGKSSSFAFSTPMAAGLTLFQHLAGKPAWRTEWHTKSKMSSFVRIDRHRARILAVCKLRACERGFVVFRDFCLMALKWKGLRKGGLFQTCLYFLKITPVRAVFAITVLQVGLRCAQKNVTQRFWKQNLFENTSDVDVFGERGRSNIKALHIDFRRTKVMSSRNFNCCKKFRTIFLLFYGLKCQMLSKRIPL